MGSPADHLDELVREIRELTPEKRAKVIEFIHRIRESDHDSIESWGAFALDQWQPGSNEEVVYSLEDARERFEVAP